MKMKFSTLGKLSDARPQTDQLFPCDVGGTTHQLLTERNHTTRSNAQNQSENVTMLLADVFGLGQGDVVMHAQC